MGGSRGIGRAIAVGFAERGCRVAVCARSRDGLDAVYDDLTATGGQAYVAECDVGDAGDIARFMPAAAAVLGGIDVLVNCASAYALSDDDAGWSASVAVDLMGSVRAGQAALPFLRASDHASIINVSSVAALRASDRRAPYGAMKAALIHQTASNAKALAPEGIRVNCIVPGSTDFDGSIWRRIRTSVPSLYEATRDSIPLGRFATPEDIAKPVFFLASLEAGWITGQSMIVDGGQTLGGF
jgi:3-oxoacyl-[acyl-carrier protein] reductase